MSVFAVIISITVLHFIKTTTVTNKEMRFKKFLIDQITKKLKYLQDVNLRKHLTLDSTRFTNP